MFRGCFPGKEMCLLGMYQIKRDTSDLIQFLERHYYYGCYLLGVNIIFNTHLQGGIEDSNLYLQLMGSDFTTQTESRELSNISDFQFSI
jgi:hypothetical protein